MSLCVEKGNRKGFYWGWPHGCFQQTAHDLLCLNLKDPGNRQISSSAPQIQNFFEGVEEENYFRERQKNHIVSDQGVLYVPVGMHLCSSYCTTRTCTVLVLVCIL